VNQGRLALLDNFVWARQVTCPWSSQLCFKRFPEVLRQYQATPVVALKWSLQKNPSMYTMSTHPRQGYIYPNGDYHRPKPVWHYTRNVGGAYPIPEAALKRIQDAIQKKISGKGIFVFAKHVKRQIELQEPKYAPVTGISFNVRCVNQQEPQNFTGKMCASLSFTVIVTAAC
jgi:hypothetical protein